MIRRIRHWPAELTFSFLMVASMLMFSAAFGLPIRLPGAQGAAFVGVHYVFPLIGVLVWGLCASLNGRRDLVPTFACALACYVTVLWVHFNLKLWAPLVNPTTYDALFWQTDQFARPLVDFSRWARTAMLPAIPHETNLYMLGFIGMFYASFCYFALRRPDKFRRLFLAALLIQGLGGLSYLMMPALGPFLYEPSVNPLAQQSQQHMLEVHQMLVARGASWLSDNGSDNLMTGLGAMPSLHTGCSFVFLWFAYRYGRILLLPFGLMFGFILVTAVADRWHYLIDLPAGILLAAFSIYLSGRLAGEKKGRETESVAESPDTSLAGIVAA